MTFDKQQPTQYAPTEDISSAMVCDNKNEEADAYTLTWTNSSGDTIQTNTGITPKPKNQLFYESYKIPSTYLGNITATLTGTDLEVNCPSEATLGRIMTCSIEAQVEDLQLVQKEVDFTCYIWDGETRYSSINFNQMVTKDLFKVNKDFSVPRTFVSREEYVLQCEANYYNLGSRTDSFYDTFNAKSVGYPQKIKKGTSNLIDKIIKKISEPSSLILILFGCFFIFLVSKGADKKYKKYKEKRKEKNLNSRETYT